MVENVTYAKSYATRKMAGCYVNAYATAKSH